MKLPIGDRDFYCCHIRLDKRDRYLLWFSGDEDGVWSDAATVCNWSSAPALYSFAASLGFSVSNEVSTPYDFDKVEEFVRGHVAIDSRDKLAAWNLLVDIASSVGALEFLTAEREQLDVYNHLFYLCDFVPAKGTNPEPLTAADNDAVRLILLSGLALLRKNLGVEDTVFSVG